MCGSMGCAFSTVTGNHIYNIWTKRMYSGAEMGAIKFHGAIDVVISHNCLHDNDKGIWIDWMAQGTRITSNVCYNNDFADLFAEVNHGPYLVDNNIFMSGIHNWSQGGAYVHNIIAGRTIVDPVSNRYTPYHFPHSTELMGVSNIVCGDDRIYNSIYIKGEYEIDNQWNRRNTGFGLDAYNLAENILPVSAGGNLYYNGAKPFKDGSGSSVADAFDPGIEIIEKEGAIYLKLSFDERLKEMETEIITSETFGEFVMIRDRFENPDGTSVELNADYFGNKRNPDNPAVGPFESAEPGENLIKIWPKE